MGGQGEQLLLKLAAQYTVHRQPAELHDQCRALVGAGTEYLIFNLIEVGDLERLQLLASEVLPALRMGT